MSGERDQWYAYHMPNGYHVWNRTHNTVRDFDTWAEALAFVDAQDELKDGEQ